MLKGKKMKNWQKNYKDLQEIKSRKGLNWDEVDMKVEGLNNLADIPYMLSLIQPFAALDNKFFYNSLISRLTGMMAVIIRENLSGKFEEMVNEEYEKEFNKHFIVNEGE